MEEISQLAPDLLKLVNGLADTQRNTGESSDITSEEIKALVSLCTLVNAKSQRATGLQLFLSMMLIACATNKQVNGIHEN